MVQIRSKAVLFETPILINAFNRPDTTKRVFDVVKKIKYTQDKMKERIEGISGKSVEKAQKQFIDKELKNYDKIAAQSATKKTM